MTEETLQDMLKPRRTNGRRPGAAPPGREYTRAPWIEGAEPKRWDAGALAAAVAPLKLKPRVFAALRQVLAVGMSYKEAGEYLGESQTYVRNAVLSVADRLGGRAWMFAPKARRALVVDNVPPELHDEARALVRALVDRHRNKVVPIGAGKK